MANRQNRGAPAHMEPQESRKSKKGLVIGLCCALVVVACAVTAFVALGRQQEAERAEAAREAEISAVLDVDTFYDGVTVDGIDLGGMTMDEARQALSAAESSASGDFTVTLTYEDQTFTVTQADVDFSFDTEAVLEQAYAYGREGDREERYETVTALAETPVNFELSATMEGGSLRTKLEELTAPLNSEPQNASVVSFDAASETFTFSEGTPGVSVDLDGLVSLVEAAIEKGGESTVEIPAAETPCSVTADDLRRNLKKLGTYSTTSTNTANGNYNMARAMSSINGTVVQPGETFSYFAVVGPAGQAEGYKAANAIVNGKLVPSYGGGICQTSTTLYGAVLRSGLEIVERSCHSIPSTYCPIGQDAAVSWPNMDLKFKNNTEYPLYIIAGMEGKVLTATIYGWQDPAWDTIEVTSWYTETIPALTKGTYSLDNSLQTGEVKLDAAGRKGYRAAAQRTYYKDGAEVKTEALATSYYRPSGPYYSYGPGTDVSNDPGVMTPSSSSAPSSSAPSSSTPESSTPASSAPSSAPESSAPAEDTPETGSSPEGTPIGPMPEE